jgi:hypothetical protein
VGSLLPFAVGVRRRRLSRSVSSVRVIVNDAGVWCDSGQDSVEGVRWDELVEGFVQTSADEANRDDVFVVFVGKEESSCVVPLSAAPPDFVERVLRLPGCDSEVLLHALRYPAKAKFVFWRR